MMKFDGHYTQNQIRDFGKFAAKMSKGKRGFRSDRLQSRARLAQHIAKHSTGGKIYVSVHGYDCDRSSFCDTYEISASVMSFELFRKNKSQWADGAMYFDILTKGESI